MMLVRRKKSSHFLNDSSSSAVFLGGKRLVQVIRHSKAWFLTAGVIIYAN